MSYDDLKQFLGVSRLSLWSCPSCGPSFLPTSVAPSPHYSWGVVLLCGICDSSWLVCKECCNVRVRFITASDCLSPHHHKHRLNDLSFTKARNDHTATTGIGGGVVHGNVSLPMSPYNLCAVQGDVVSLPMSPSVIDCSTLQTDPANVSLAIFYINNSTLLCSPSNDVSSSESCIEVLLEHSQSAEDSTAILQQSQSLHKPSEVDLITESTQSDSNHSSNAGFPLLGDVSYDSTQECSNDSSNTALPKVPDISYDSTHVGNKDKGNVVEVSDVVELDESPPINVLPTSVGFSFGDHNAHKFILVDIPISILEAIYSAVSVFPITQYEVICSALKQIRLYQAFNMLFPKDNNRWDNFLSVLKSQFLKNHPHLDVSEINATVLVTDDPMDRPQQPHMDYCWETILLPS
jgi:hypothetical protein